MSKDFGGRRMARRAFLTSIGRAAGTSAMLRTMSAIGLGASSATLAACGSSAAGAATPGNPGPGPQPAPPSPHPGDWPANIGVGKSVIVLGAGIAGMTTTLEMRRLGYECTLLEAAATAGGRTRTIRAGDAVSETDSHQVCTFDVDDELYFNPGPARIPHHHEFLLGYCREFDIALEAFVNDNRAGLLHSPQAFDGQAQVARHVIADTRGNIARLLALSLNQNALDQELSPTDKANILAMLRDFGDLDSSYDYTGTTRAGFPGQKATGSRRRGELVEPLDLQTLIGDAFWQARQDYPQELDQQPVMLQPVGGMDRIARAFELRVSSELRFEAVVTEIRKTPTGVRVHYNHLGTPSTLEADYCVCTIPATVLRGISNDFSAAHAAAVNGFEYASAGKLAFQSRRFWEQDHNIYGGISWTTQEITQLWYPSNAFGRQNGIMLGTYTFGGTEGDTFTHRSPQERIDAARTQAAALHVNVGNEVDRGISVAWAKIPLQLGAWGMSDPGILLTPDDSIFFAGEHLSILQSWQEGAILSAYHAIDAIVMQDSA